MIPSALPRPRTAVAGGARVAKPKAALRLAKQIVAAIYDGAMKPGDRFFGEGEALGQLGVSRGSYREALRFLEIQGVVEVRAGPGGGPEIRRPGWPQLASTVALLLQFAEAPLRVVLDARTVLEPGVARMAAARATEADVRLLSDDLDAIEADLGNYPRFAASYARFWDHLAASTHNAFLALLSPALRGIVNSSGFVPNETYREALLGRLRRIQAAVAEHDPDRASALMTALELEMGERLSTGYPRQVDRVISWADLDVELTADVSGGD